MAITDANLVLGRILPEFFPNIFGPSENESLDTAAAQEAMQDITAQVNQQAKSAGQPEKSVDEVSSAKDGAYLLCWQLQLLREGVDVKCTVVQVQWSAWLAALLQAVHGALPASGQWLRLPQQQGCWSPCTTLGCLAAALRKQTHRVHVDVRAQPRRFDM